MPDILQNSAPQSLRLRPERRIYIGRLRTLRGTLTGGEATGGITWFMDVFPAVVPDADRVLPVLALRPAWRRRVDGAAMERAFGVWRAGREVVETDALSIVEDWRCFVPERLRGDSYPHTIDLTLRRAARLDAASAMDRSRLLRSFWSDQPALFCMPELHRSRWDATVPLADVDAAHAAWFETERRSGGGPGRHDSVAPPALDLQLLLALPRTARVAERVQLVGAVVNALARARPDHEALARFELLTEVQRAAANESLASRLEGWDATVSAHGLYPLVIPELDPEWSTHPGTLTIPERCDAWLSGWCRDDRGYRMLVAAIGPHRASFRTPLGGRFEDLRRGLSLPLLRARSADGGAEGVGAFMTPKQFASWRGIEMPAGGGRREKRSLNSVSPELRRKIRAMKDP